VDSIVNIRKRCEISRHQYAGWAAGWLIGNADGESYGIQRQLLCHSLSTRKTLVVGIIFATVMAFTAAAISGHSWTYAWLLAEILLGGIRLGVLNSFEKAEARGKVGDAIAPVFAGLAWVIVLSAAYYLCVASGEWILILLAGIGLAGIIGGASSRNAGTPRYGVIVMCLVALPYSLAAIMSPIPYLFLVGLQIPLCLAGMILVLLENYKILLGLHKAEKENLRLAHHDLLTGLPNRIMKRKRLNELLCGPLSSTVGREHFTVFCLDLDGFKEVNDRYGHAVGDAILIAVACRLRGSVREHDFVCRVGGDEFVVLLPSVSACEAASIARRVIDEISKPFVLGPSMQPRVGISIGGACAPRDGVNADELLRSADRALYEAKRRGKGVYVVQSAAISEVVELAPSADADARLAPGFSGQNEAGATAGHSPRFSEFHSTRTVDLRVYRAEKST
jgi:diguanylate cyclase (GGDEF)-like protein